MADPTGNASCLHLVVRSSAEVLESCLSQCAGEDDVVFIDDGVMHLVNSLQNGCGPGPAESLFSAEDLDARGLLPAARAAGAATVRDSDIVALLRKHDFCLTWK